MAGHSKWANIQHRKKAQDAKRGKVFTRLIREITVAARMGGSDLAANPRLRLAVDKALAANMPKDTIERASKRGAGELDGVTYEEFRYEGYGPAGVAIIVDTMTDNRNRTVAEVRHAFSKSGGNLGTAGSVAFQFTETGVLSFPPDSDEDAIMEAALEAGANDVIAAEDGSIEVLTAPSEFADVNAAMEQAGLIPEDAEVTMRAEVMAELSVDDAQKMLRLLDTLEELDDTQNVYSNAEFPAEVLADLSASAVLVSARTRILGIDPGLQSTGYGIVDIIDNHSHHVDNGCIRTASGTPLPVRLRTIFSGLCELVDRFQPDQAAVEQVFMHRNAAAALKLGQARGAAICAVAQDGVTFGEYAPREIKQAVVGRGGADKLQVQHMVSMLLGLREKPQADAADALAVAICHGHQQATAARTGVPLALLSRRR